MIYITHTRVVFIQTSMKCAHVRKSYVLGIDNNCIVGMAFTFPLYAYVTREGQTP